MWEIKQTDEFIRQRKYYEKKRRRESTAVFNNLDTFHKALSSGIQPKQATFGFTHAEPFDVVAIDQKGGGPNLAQIRLYVLPDVRRKVLCLITLGDKKSQPEDIKLIKRFVEKLPDLEKNASVEEPDVHDSGGDGAVNK